MSNVGDRRVTANLSLTLDGRYNGPGGATDLSHIVPYAVTDLARDHMTRIWENATTAVLGRVNAEGFLGYWPSVVSNDQADPRDRAYAKWLTEVEKLVFSTTLSASPWDRTTLVNGPVSEVMGISRRQGRATSWSTAAPASLRHFWPPTCWIGCTL